MAELYVIDTNALIATFASVFNLKNDISNHINRIIQSAIFDKYPNSRLSIPSIVFTELYDGYCNNKESIRKIYYEIYIPITSSDFVEIRAIDREIIETVLTIEGNLVNHDPNDKIVLANSICLACPLISKDPEIKKYIESELGYEYIVY